MIKTTFICAFAFLTFLLFMPLASIMAEEKVKAEVKNEQGKEARPDLDTAKVELTLPDIQNGSAHIVLSSPERKFFSPTDFPMVEGTKLIDSTLSVENGKASFDYMFPIRGDYGMKVEVMDEKGNSVGTHKLFINIQENPSEVKKGIIFIAFLVLFGFIAGFVLAKRRKTVHAI
jgi:hypothetical protein